MKPITALLFALSAAEASAWMQSEVSPRSPPSRRPSPREQRTAADVAERKALHAKKLARRAARHQGKRT